LARDRQVDNLTSVIMWHLDNLCYVLQDFSLRTILAFGLQSDFGLFRKVKIVELAENCDSYRLVLTKRDNKPYLVLYLSEKGSLF